MRPDPVKLLLLILAMSPVVAGSEWRKQRSGSLAWLYSVQFLDADYGFAAGSNGTLLGTTNGGAEWKKLPLPITDTIRDVHFFDRSSGWMLCDRGKFRSGKNASFLLRTSDGGRTWSFVEFNSSAERYSRMFFSSKGVGYLVGEGGVISGLPSGETEAFKGILPVRFLMTDGVVVDESRIILAGGGGSLMLSDDHGRNWQAVRSVDPRPEWKLNAIHFVDRQDGWVSGNHGWVFSTTDGGRSWRSRPTGTQADLLDIVFLDREFGFVVGDGGVVLGTNDSGRTWTPENSGSKHRLERLVFAGKRAIAVGFGGTIIWKDLP